ncbi:MAG: Rhomboid family protein [Bacteroidota bacterium]|nr:Rhomboid family protein [Bacteroidota bacterium]
MKKAASIPVTFVALMWMIHIFQVVYRIDLGNLGIYPRDLHTITGILTSPLIHGSWEHLLSNTFPLLVLALLLFLTYEKIATAVWTMNYLFTGLLVWLFARDSYHIGASGIIYGLASFLLFSGFFRMDIKAIAIASGVAIFYGGMVWGILPIQPGVSWESHLFGGIVGFILAFIYRNKYKDAVIELHENEVSTRKTFEDFLENK